MHHSHQSSTAKEPVALEPGQEERRDAHALILSGAGIGVFGAVAAAIGGAVCPVCVVAAPALVGLGVYRRWQARRPPASKATP